VLIAGIDSAPSRTTLLTDTLIVVSLDPSTGDVAMVSFPRDIARFPLWDGRTYTGKINELYSWARRHPEEFPEGGMATITREVGYLLGIDVEHYASVNMGGFERMIDEVGGVTIVNERAINDPSYGGWRDGRVGFRLPAGRHTLDGQTALAYVRSRKGAGDNDFSRARRQQQVLVALAAKLSDPGMVPRLPGILDAASRTVSTNFPAERLGEMLELARRLDDEDVRHVVLGPPYATHPPTSTTGGIYTLSLDLDKVADLSVELFGEESRYAEVGAPG
jgi:LCP family protein required for cell wall assembly